MMFDNWFLVTFVVILAVVGLFCLYESRRLRWMRLRFPILRTPKPPKKREWMLWVGDGIEPAGSWVIDFPVDINGRKGKVVDFTALKILVEWED